ncbi:hypothetical protein B0I37DRAFT_166693 [Chaetomium sp. MPI-CAGE-AT-0009]|nr:hypothetical protein B0I37DRAFT_166693 [Chaetomium sp. MPI-CAGE-AT-0009]
MPRHTTDPVRPHPRLGWGTVVIYSAGAGVVGVVAMTAAEKVEQLFTGRANSEVPGRTLARLINANPQTKEELWGLNMAMHYGQGATAAVIRGIASCYGLRGPFTDFMFVGVRLMIDQTLENWTGVGSPPWTWPVGEQVVDLLHKAVFAFVTGYLTDRWIQ